MTVSGVTMRLIGWAIALAAAGLTPAAAQTPTTPAPAATAQSTTVAPADARATAPAATAIVPGTVGHMIPTPGIGEPDGRKGIQEQVTPIGQEAARFHNVFLLAVCAIISLIVLGLLLYAMVRFRRGSNPLPSHNSHNPLLEVAGTLTTVIILIT